jgi:hypothetical protein
MNSGPVTVGLGCIAALALWKVTKERWFPTLFGWVVIAVTIKWMDKVDDWLLGWLISTAGCAVFAAWIYGLKWYDKRIEQITKSNPSHILAKKLSDQKPEPEELEFHLDVTTERDHTDSGWEYWDVFPNQKRLTHQRCHGGPPTHEEIYEYAVRHTSVFVRLIEKSEQGFDEPEYKVFGGAINTARLEEDYAKKIKKYENDPNKDLFLSDTPEIISAELQKEIVWHEIHGAIRYFVLNKDVPVVHEANFFRGELERFTNAFASIARRAEELGAVWNDNFYRYEAPESAPPEAKESTRKELSVFNFGFRNRYEFLQKDIILGVLTDAVGGKK